MIDHGPDPTRNGHDGPGDCGEYRDRASAVHDGEPVGTERDRAWRRHALSCDACKEFDRRLSEVAGDLAAIRGTPVRDLWPELRRASSRARPARTRTSAGLAVAAAGALATWGTLSWLAGDRAPGVDRALGVERALAAIASESSDQVELARLLETPELRLLARLGAVKEDVR